MNITLSVSDEVVERARAVAQQQGTSLNSLVRGYLESLAGRGRGEELAQRFDELWSGRSGRSGGWLFDREELYEDRVDPSRR